MKIYLDNGATTKMSTEVVRAMLPYFTKEYGNASSLHKFGRDAREELEKARKVIADKINADVNEIIFTSGGSESDNMAVKGAAYNKRKGQIIISKIEHPAVMNTCKFLEKEGFDVDYLDVDENGFVSVDQLKEKIRKDTILVSIIHANNEIGVVQDVAQIGAICKEAGVIFHTDAVQSFCKEVIDVKEMNIDLLSLSAHKIHGPKGIGALYIKKGVKLNKLISGGEQEFKLRSGTENVAGAVGFAKAVEIFSEDECKKIKALRNVLMTELLKIKDTKLNGDDHKRLCNNVNISFKYVEGESLLMKLDDKGIAVSTGSACSSHSLEPSHVLIALGMKHEDAHGSIRFTLSRYNTIEEIKYTIKVVKEAVEELRKMSALRG